MIFIGKKQKFKQKTIKGPSINYVVSKSEIFDPLPPPLLSFLLKVFIWTYMHTTVHLTNHSNINQFFMSHKPFDMFLMCNAVLTKYSTPRLVRYINCKYSLGDCIFSVAWIQTCWDVNISDPLLVLEHNFKQKREKLTAIQQWTAAE